MTDNPELAADSQYEIVKRYETLAQDFLKSMIKRVWSLMRFIQPHILWNDKGEVTIDEVQTSMSYIVEIIKVHFNDYKDCHLVGKEAFESFVCLI